MNRICFVVSILSIALISACGGHGPGGHHDHRFDDPEKWAKRWNSPERDAWQKPGVVLAAMEIAPGMVVADLGTGTGYFLTHLADAVGEQGRVLALDVEPAMVQFIEERTAKEPKLVTVEARRVPLDDPGLEPNSVDRVLIVNTWHHIGQRRDYSAKLLKALKPGGAVVIVDFKPGDGIPGAPQHMRLASKVIAAELEAGGLKAEISKVNLPRQYVVIGRKP